MRISLLARTVVLSAMFLPLVAWADGYKAGDSFIGFSVSDQHGQQVDFKAGDAKFILLDTPGETGKAKNPKSPEWFAKHEALLVINLSQMSSFKRKAALSRMGSKPFQLLVLQDKGMAARFPQENGKFTVLVLDAKGGITAVKFAAPGQELQDLVGGADE